MNIMHPTNTLSKDSLNMIPSDENTMNVVLLCDIDDQLKFDFVIFWLSYMNHYFTKHYLEYQINFDYETNINIYNLSSTPTIRILHKKFYIDFVEININDYTYEYLKNIIEENIKLLITKNNTTNE
jgi:hypothetical protein